MIVDSKNIEFGYELISVIPFANYLNSIGELEKTISAIDTECLYFFSPEHEINPNQRAFGNTPQCTCPNIRIHKDYLDKRQFLAPDYKTYFANETFKFSKETIVICNRYNIEWGVGPINYFDIPTLRKIFELLQDKYQVIYINIQGKKEYYDSDQEVLKLDDYKLLKEYPKVINIHELHTFHPELSFNTLQLMIFANCQKFITMNGGHSILAAYFGGENIIYSRFGNPMAQELRAENNSFYRWYHEFSGQRVVHVADYDELLHRINIQWVKKEPVVNVLVRTSARPNFFAKCIDSILNQTYENINIYVSIDDKKNDYTVKYPVYPVFVDRKKDFPQVDYGEQYGKVFPYNDYLNDLQAKVKEGLILILDDDDEYIDKRAIEKIINEYKKGYELIFWIVKIDSLVIPDSDKLGKEPELYKMSMIGFAYDVKHRIKFLPYKRADYRVAHKLWKAIDKSKIIGINEILSAAQDGAHYGQRVDKVETNKNEEDMVPKVEVEIIKDRNQHGKFDVVIGSIMEIPEHVAKGWVKTGIAKYVKKQVIEIPAPKETVKEKIEAAKPLPKRVIKKKKRR